jgi:transcription elongation GreA/GreB family factor
MEETVARAAVVDPGDAERGAAVIGSTVQIEDLDSGTISQYRLASAHHSLGPDAISAAPRSARRSSAPPQGRSSRSTCRTAGPGACDSRT